MKYVLYIDYVGAEFEYKDLTAENMAEAILESDAFYNGETMWMVRIMEKSGKKYHVDKGVTSQDYMGVIEKRFGRWVKYEGEHIVAHDVAKRGAWYRLVK